MDETFKYYIVKIIPAQKNVYYDLLIIYMKPMKNKNCCDKNQKVVASVIGRWAINWRGPERNFLRG